MQEEQEAHILISHISFLHNKFRNIPSFRNGEWLSECVSESSRDVTRAREPLLSFVRKLILSIEYIIWSGFKELETVTLENFTSCLNGMGVFIKQRSNMKNFLGDLQFNPLLIISVCCLSFSPKCCIYVPSKLFLISIRTLFHVNVNWRLHSRGFIVMILHRVCAMHRQTLLPLVWEAVSRRTSKCTCLYVCVMLIFWEMLGPEGWEKTYNKNTMVHDTSDGRAI